MLALLLTLALSLSTHPASPFESYLQGYLETASLSWLDLPDCSTEPRRCADFQAQEGETPADVADRAAAVAGAVARAVESSGEAAYSEADAESHVRMGLLLMSLAFHESRFRGYVADGRCNDPAWRTSPEGKQRMRLGPCDGGLASTPWQMHIGRGLYLHEGGWSSGRRAPGDVLVTASDARALENAATLALHMTRASLKATGTLRYYTGEWEGGAPKARARQERAESYLRAHPLPSD